jgi:hypothetical protein
MPISHSGGIHAIRPFAAFCQQSELGFRPVRRTLKRGIKSLLYRWFRNDLGLLAPVSDGADGHA